MGSWIKIIAMSAAGIFVGAILIGLVFTAPLGWALIAFSIGYPCWKFFRAVVRGSVRGGHAAGTAIGERVGKRIANRNKR